MAGAAEKALCPPRRLVLGDHLLPAAGVAGGGEKQLRGPRRRAGCPRPNQRRQTMVMNPVAWQPGFETTHRAPADRPPGGAGPQLREAVGPAGGGAVGGGGVDHPGAGALRQGHGLHSRRVRQAQKHDVRFRHQPFPFVRVLPLRLVDQQQVDVVPRRQPVIGKMWSFLEPVPPAIPIIIIIIECILKQNCYFCIRLNTLSPVSITKARDN